MPKNDSYNLRIKMGLVSQGLIPPSKAKRWFSTKVVFICCGELKIRITESGVIAAGSWDHWLELMMRAFQGEGCTGKITFELLG